MKQKNQGGIYQKQHAFDKHNGIVQNRTQEFCSIFYAYSKYNKTECKVKKNVVSFGSTKNDGTKKENLKELVLFYFVCMLNATSMFLAQQKNIILELLNFSPLVRNTCN